MGNRVSKSDWGKLSDAAKNDELLKSFTPFANEFHALMIGTSPLFRNRSHRPAIALPCLALASALSAQCPIIVHFPGIALGGVLHEGRFGLKYEARAARSNVGS
jgi:hypothetical protein